MIAVDTNVLARYLLADDRRQAAIAAALLEGRSQFTAPPLSAKEDEFVTFDRALVKQAAKAGTTPGAAAAR